MSNKHKVILACSAGLFLLLSILLFRYVLAFEIERQAKNSSIPTWIYWVLGISLLSTCVWRIYTRRIKPSATTSAAAPKTKKPFKVQKSLAKALWTLIWIGGLWVTVPWAWQGCKKMAAPLETPFPRRHVQPNTSNDSEVIDGVRYYNVKMYQAPTDKYVVVKLPPYKNVECWISPHAKIPKKIRMFAETAQGRTTIEGLSTEKFTELPTSGLIRYGFQSLENEPLQIRIATSTP